MYSSDDEIFITPVPNLSKVDISEDSNDHGYLQLLSYGLNETEPQPYCPETEDISDDELLSEVNKIESSQTYKDLQQDENRFRNPRTDQQMMDIGRRSLSQATHRKINWAVKMFEEWKKNRNARAEDPNLGISIIYPDLLQMTKDELNYCLSRFITEVRKPSQAEYPGNTLYDLVISIQLYLEYHGRALKLLNDPNFSELKNSLDRMMKERANAGLGVVKKQANVIEESDEIAMWEKGLLGKDNPTKLRNTLLYLIGLNFGLRAGNEHRQLRRFPECQIHVEKRGGQDILVYYEDVSKSNQGGLKHRHVNAKKVEAYPSQNPDHCIVKLFKLYMSKLPQGSDKYDAFYLRSLQKWEVEGGVWYSVMPVGYKCLSQVVSNLAKEAGLVGFYSNHSLRATTASRLYNKGVDEQLITETTGHRSLAVRSYKRTTPALKRKVSELLEPEPEKNKTNQIDVSKKTNVHVRGTSDLPNINININFV